MAIFAASQKSVAALAHRLGFGRPAGCRAPHLVYASDPAAPICSHEMRRYQRPLVYFPPSNHFERLAGTSPKRYSIRVTRQYRITFEWTGKDAENVRYEDYH